MQVSRKQRKVQRSKWKRYVLFAVAIAVPLIAAGVLVWTTKPCLPVISASPFTHIAAKRGETFSHTLSIVNTYDKSISACDIAIVSKSGLFVNDAPFDDESLIVSREYLGKWDVIPGPLQSVIDPELWGDANRPMSWQWANPNVDLESSEVKQLEFEFGINPSLPPDKYRIELRVNGFTAEILEIDVK